jgi:flavodoxin
MRVLVAYMSKTGNTKRVAEAISEGISDAKDVKPISAVGNLDGYDIAFLGFPVLRGGPDKKSKEILEKLCVKDKNVALFITHASPEDSHELPQTLDKFRRAARGAKLVDMFDCQGELANGVRLVMSILPDAQLRRWAKQDTSKGQPDKNRLEKARAFSGKVMKRFHDKE